MMYDCWIFDWTIWFGCNPLLFPSPPKSNQIVTLRNAIKTMTKQWYNNNKQQTIVEKTIEQQFVDLLSVCHWQIATSSIGLYNAQ